MEHFSIAGFNYFDLTVGAIILILAIKGLLNGVVKEVASLLGLAGGVYLGSRMSHKAASFIEQNFIHIENISLLKLLGFMAILVAVWVGATLLGALLSRLLFKEGPNIMARILGFIVGGVKYFVVFALIVTALSNVTLIRDNLSAYIESSRLYPLLHQTGSIFITPKSVIKTTPANKTETNSSEQHI